MRTTAIVNGFAPGTPSDVRTPNEVARALAEIGLNKRARHSKMSNSRVQQITMTAFAYRELVKGTHSREMCRILVDASSPGRRSVRAGMSDRTISVPPWPS